MCVARESLSRRITHLDRFCMVFPRERVDDTLAVHGGEQLEEPVSWHGHLSFQAHKGELHTQRQKASEASR